MGKNKLDEWITVWWNATPEPDDRRWVGSVDTENASMARKIGRAIQ